MSTITLRTFFDLFFVLYAMVGIGVGWAVYDAIDKEISGSRHAKTGFGIICGIFWPMLLGYRMIETWIHS